MTDALAFSFNEVAALAAKAARGAGLGWGHAEDLGRASRWLAEHGLAWEVALCRLLEDAGAGARTSRLAEAADWAAQAASGESRTLEAREPIWLPPLASAALFGRAHGLAIRRAGAAVYIFSDGTAAGDLRALEMAEGAWLTLEAVADPTARARRPERLTRPGPASAAAVARLSALADLTLVPASDASRAKGAGSDRTDND